MAGGFGSRLKRAVSDVPKPLAPVNGRPFIFYLLDNWLLRGVREIVFLLYHESRKIESAVDRYISENGATNLNVRYVLEPEPLGTGGSVFHAIQELGIRDSFIVANADTWLGDGVTSLNEFPSNAIGVVRVENVGRYGRVLLEKNKIQFFDKKILVPFGEFLPFRKYLKFMENISGSTDFQTGKKNRILITEDNFRIFPIICYEVIFDKIFKNIEKNNIDIMINITNDSWFGTKLGPYQHFYIARIKSLIANKPLIRVSNNGISAIIDNKGKIIKSTQLNKISNLKHKLKISKNKSYYFLHKLLSYYLLISFIFLFIINLKNKHEQ